MVGYATRAYDPGWENGWPFGPEDGPFGPGISRTTPTPRPAPSPLGVPPSTPSARAQRQDGGGADLCVRSHGHSSENTRPDGQRTNPDRAGPTPTPGHPTQLAQRSNNSFRGPRGSKRIGETTFISDQRLACSPNRPADHVRRLDSDSTTTSDDHRLEPLSGFWPDLGIAFRGYRVAEPPATLLNPFGDDVPGTDGLGRGDACSTRSCGRTVVSNNRRGNEPPGLSAPCGAHWAGICGGRALVGTPVPPLCSPVRCRWARGRRIQPHTPPDPAPLVLFHRLSSFHPLLSRPVFCYLPPSAQQWLRGTTFGDRTATILVAMCRVARSFR